MLRAVIVAAMLACAAAPAAADDIVRVRQRTMVPWSGKADGIERTYVAAGLRLKFTFQFDTAETITPILHLASADGATIDAKGAAGFGDVAQARFGIGEIDPTNDSPEIVFTSYTGGAHCCTLVVILSKTASGWQKVELGPIDGEPLYEFPRDVTGDGAADVVVNDDRFAYAFAAYAFSWPPPMVYEVRFGRGIDASKNPAYAKLFERDMREARDKCFDDTNENRNGACAGFIADAARLGLRDEKWRQMLSRYNRADRWEYPKGCKTMLENDQCPKGQEIVFATFPEALKWFLDHNGY